MGAARRPLSMARGALAQINDLAFQASEYTRFRASEYK